MTLGQRIKEARLEAGLSQRQLAGDVMTRNMLSALEHDGANPSVATLKYLSEKLCKPISYFLGEDLPKIPEAEEMEAVRNLFQCREFRECLKAMQPLEHPAFSSERCLMKAICLLELAQQAKEEGKLPYSRELLGQCESLIEECHYLQPELRRRWRILAAGAAGERELPALAAGIPGDDEAMLLRARGAVLGGEYDKAERLLEAMDCRSKGDWCFLRGEIHLYKKEYAKAAECYHKAEEERPDESGEKLEICYREMGDFKMAYYYAKKEKTGK